MKISSISIATAVLPTAAWAQLETTGRLRSSRSRAEDLGVFMDEMSLAPTSLSMQLMGNGGKRGSKSGKASEKGAKSRKSPADFLCSDHYPTLDLSEAFQPLHMPPQVYPDKNGTTRLDLVWNLAYYRGPSFSTIVRSFNGGFPGPTIHVAQGGRLEIKLVNCMYPPLGFEGPESHNRYHLPNSTNLHTHGPHISAESPGDDVFLRIDPREDFDYMYEFNENHMPGTFWYHPHLHGSTALHTGAGSSGMLIMDDPEDYNIPAAIKKMPEVQIVFQHINLKLLRDIARISQDDVTNWIDHNFEITNKTTDLTNIMLANMQFLPKITMEQGKWYRWRMVMSSIEVGLAFMSQSKTCEMKLLAKDGIYLSDAPRDVEAVILSPGNRADIAIRCYELGQEYMNSTNIDLDTRFDPSDQYITESQDDPSVEEIVGTYLDPESQPTVLVVDVIPNQDDQDGDIDPFIAPTPCYLVDLTRVDESEIDTHFTVQYRCIDDFCGVYGPYGVGGDTSEFIPWVDNHTYINDFATGTVQEISHPFNAFHPYHQHINPYQIYHINQELEKIVADWYQVGDWQDTLQIPMASSNFGTVKFRFQADQFTGHMVQHCHLLFHEDKGMMAQYNVTGEEGDVWPGAKLIDPQCIPAK
mmetsp:Transcript_5822/g.12798  ORF Transcript_5822/g.12798 Transcript_5822/m.12798 type:complete len:640 (+) Transcript_5822:96-2015(+)|eukprot:CAMPEP_0172530382 /NCGR_PEP_ID=MMETSP1067-20121228/4128_1 /TAXON_ID=265564 ORGANISM="Thalassiosira punctigera, Strain Tpunct2005C2" /NCGR_SAMPLE_ID=MMETSP1067 /ASSEMBLY_ACC=CAM_ASM_000444 /LENGTH=639 /DNA_ID=CAMNT_0013314575 /DNA_START=96 /DNA_END=2015 /DNA_ORIENTATION=+